MSVEVDNVWKRYKKFYELRDGEGRDRLGGEVPLLVIVFSQGY